MSPNMVIYKANISILKFILWAISSWRYMLILCWRLELGPRFWAGELGRKCQAHSYSWAIWPLFWLNGRRAAQAWQAEPATRQAGWRGQLSTSALTGRMAETARALTFVVGRSLPTDFRHFWTRLGWKNSQPWRKIPLTIEGADNLAPN